MNQSTKTITDVRAKLLPRISGWFFDRPWLTLAIWLVLTVFGIMSYTVLLKREGFPSVSIPIVIVNGTYAVNDPAKVDSTLAAPISELALKQPHVKSVTTTTEGNFLNAVIQFDEGTDSTAAKDNLQKIVADDHRIPSSAQLEYSAPYFGVTGGSSKKIDATIALYDPTNKQSEQQLNAVAQNAADYLNRQNRTLVASYFVSNPFQNVVNPDTGKAMTVQRSFDRYGERSGGATNFYPSAVINVSSVQGADVIKLDNEIRSALDKLHAQPQFAGVRTAVTASYAPTIRQEISELQRVLLEGLLAVLIVGSIIIAVRASLITVISMVTVISIALGMIYLFGYSLNVITLFALILGLSLIVDDTIIMVEAIDSARRHNTDRRIAVREAAQKIGRAMIAATLTATLSFVPLLFVGGILGSFVRAIPATIITALLISLVAALLFIPLFARNILLGKKQMGEGNVREIAAVLETRIARGIGRPMTWMRGSRKREFSIGTTAVLIGFAFIFAGVMIARNVAFNIFPPSKDTNQLSVAMTFPAGTTIARAEAISGRIDQETSAVLGDNLIKASYYGMGSNRTATLFIDLKPYDKRKPTAPELADTLNTKLADIKGAKISAHPVDIGPPASSFDINITATDRTAAIYLASDMTHYLNGLKLTRANGSQATIVDVSISNTDIYKRVSNKPVITVSATFDAKDTSTLTTLAEKTVKDHYTSDRLRQFGMKPGDVNFNLGQESENQNSFKALLYAFPLVLLAIYILLSIQFRSFLQPLLIFMALPFSFFGIALGLDLTDNPFSFFAMLGFFALIGLSIKNTILLTDYANQARRAGLGPVDAVVGALGERFRPLVATSLTAVFSLIPLAITSPFWQGLAVVLIFGLLSSTLLVIFIFPYYYLGAEYLRMRISRKIFFIWLGSVVIAGGIAGQITRSPWITAAVAVIVTILMIVDVRAMSRRLSGKS